MGSTSKGKGRNGQLERALGLVKRLNLVGGLDVYGLAKDYGVAVRTIRRDLEAIEAAGFALGQEVTEEHGKKRWRYDPKTDAERKFASALDAQHFLALRLAMEQAGAMSSESALFANLEDLSDRIEKAVGPKGRARLAAIERCFMSWDKHAYMEAPKEYLLPLVRAIESELLCQVTYRAASGAGVERSYELLPLRLFVHDRAVYLLCKFKGARGVGMLNLRRLVALEVTERRGEPPTNFDAKRWAESAFTLYPGERPVRYVLRFTPEVAPFIKERRWHPSQALRELRGGGVELSFTCGESYEVASWVASWRSHVKVVRPASLVAELRDLGKWLTGCYGRTESPGQR